MLHFLLHKNVCEKGLSQANTNLETSKSGYLTDWCVVCLSMQQMKASPGIREADFSPFGI